MRPCPLNLLKTHQGQVQRGVQAAQRERKRHRGPGSHSTGQKVSPTEAEPLSALTAPELAATSPELGYFVTTQ